MLYYKSWIFWCSDSILIPLLISDDPGGRNLQILMIFWGQNMKSMKTSHERYQIIGFLVFRFHSETPFWPQMILGVVTSIYQCDLWRSKYEINKNKTYEVSNVINVINFSMLIIQKKQGLHASERSFKTDLLFPLNG